MPPLIVAAGVLGGAALARWVWRTARTVKSELEEMRLSQMAESNHQQAEIPTLRRDPQTGAYRPG